MKKLLAMLLAALMLVCVGTAALADASITFQMGGEPECMDPTINDYSSGSYALQSLFRGLYKYDADGALVPAMAVGASSPSVVAPLPRTVASKL